MNHSVSSEFFRLNSELLDQAMEKITHCLDQLNEAQIWWRPEKSMNSIGNLMLHMAGNLNQWGVVPFTMAPDRRDREAEFECEIRLTTSELSNKIQSVVNEAKNQWRHLADGQLNRQIQIQGFDVTYMEAVIHTASHFVGHTHQIIQLTRLQLGAAYRFHWTPSQERGQLPI